MHLSLSLLAGLLAATSFGAPLEKRVATPHVNDIDILNYALTLEYLERKFYSEGLAKFKERDFALHGYDHAFYKNLKQIYADEKTHVTFLSTALGDKAIAEPSFAFPITDLQSFLGLSSILEGVGVSAYLGAAASIVNKNYLTAAGSILTVEARHSSYIRAWIGDKPFPQPFDTPLDFNSVFSLAAQFITGFAEGTKVPFKAFPALTVTDPSGCGYTAGESSVVFTGAHKAAPKAGKVYAVFYSGLQTYYVPVKTSGDDYTVTIPGANFAMAGQPAPAGQVYVVLSTADGKKTKVSDENTIAGVGLIEVKA